MDEMVEIACENLGGINVLVNNAGAAERFTEITEKPVAEWDQLINVNLSAAFLCSRAAAPALLDREGCIVNISSVAGLRPMTSQVAYKSAKSGINILTPSLALEWEQEASD